jgi:hypothetical protein
VTAWTPTLNFVHTSPSYPGNHARQLDCTECHVSNSQAVSYRNAAYAPNCAACHANDYRAGEHRKYGNVNYTVSELRDCAGSCHTYTDSSMTVIRDRKNSHHRVNSGSFD